VVRVMALAFDLQDYSYQAVPMPSAFSFQFIVGLCAISCVYQYRENIVDCWLLCGVGLLTVKVCPAFCEFSAKCSDLVHRSTAPPFLGHTSEVDIATRA
jgi:hypothetical protein